MRRIAIVGAGQAGLILAHALVGEGYHVTLYSDRTADQWLHEARPTGTAYLFAESIAIERDLGIDHWSAGMHAGQGMHIDVASPDGGIALRVLGHSARQGGAVDQRLKFHRWMNDLEAKGGEVVIESVTLERADAIAAASDLTIIAAGKAELGRIVPRDAARSVYDRPARRLAMAIVTGATGWAEEAGMTAVKYSQLGPLGEMFWVPFTHKTAGPSWSVIVEAQPGGPLDIFQSMQSGAEVVDAVRALVRTYAPWDYASIADMSLADDDPFGWLVGAFPPTVRVAFGRLPSGAAVMPVGDSATTFDPIGGQGGNNASHHAKFLADEIVARGVLPFDPAWMVATWETYWGRHARDAYRFNNLFLEAPTPGLLELLGAAARDRRVADQVLVANIMKPRNYFPWIEDGDATRQVIAAARFAG
ncbi:MAG: styrene monooxygenase/indole monooxygenase family protein [Sphingomonadales bacterium]